MRRNHTWNFDYRQLTVTEKIGACCLPDGSCVEGLTEQQCQDRNGVEWHLGKACREVQCPPPGCNGNEKITMTRCVTRRGRTRKVIVVTREATPFLKYTARLDTGETLIKPANSAGNVKFKFKGENAPRCGGNGVTVCNKRVPFDCEC